METSRYFLCIDDDEDDCALFAEAIKSTHPEVTVRHIDCGDKAVSFLATAVLEGKLPELIVLDLNMPRMNGHETFQKIREIVPVYIPVLFLTTTPGDNDIKVGEKHGAAMMAKPATVNGYREIVRTIFQSIV